MGTQVLLNKLPGVPAALCPHCWEEEVPGPGGITDLRWGTIKGEYMLPC